MQAVEIIPSGRKGHVYHALANAIAVYDIATRMVRASGAMILVYFSRIISTNVFNFTVDASVCLRAGTLWLYN